MLFILNFFLCVNAHAEAPDFNATIIRAASINSFNYKSDFEKWFNFKTTAAYEIRASVLKGIASKNGYSLGNTITEISIQYSCCDLSKSLCRDQDYVLTFTGKDLDGATFVAGCDDKGNSVNSTIGEDNASKLSTVDATAHASIPALK